MTDLRFYKKKRMMAKRDDLLEEIGEAVFEAGSLPESFADLPREFRGLDSLLRQLQDRKLALQRDLDKAEDTYAEQQRELARIEADHAKEIKPHRKARDEVALKLRHHRDKVRRMALRPKQQDLLDDLERRYKTLSDTVKALEKEHSRHIQSFQESMEPLEQRREKLNRGIHQVEEEQARLRTNRQRRLRDLGYHYYEKRLDDANFGVKYGQLKILKMELAHSRQEHQHEDFSPVRKQVEHPWKWVWVVILGASLTGFLFRTEFREEELNLEALAAPFQQNQAWSLYVDLAKVDRLSISPYLPNLQALPGGTAFRDFTTDDMVVVAASGEQLQTPEFLAVMLRRPPVRFGNRLRQMGWRYIRVPGDWLALTKDQRVWVMLNPRQFLFLPLSELYRLKEAPQAEAPRDLLLSGPLAPFDANKPILSGGDRFVLKLQTQAYEFQIPFEELPDDWPLRAKLLASRQQAGGEVSAGQPVFSLTERGFFMRGRRGDYKPQTFTAKDLRDYLELQLAQLLSRPPAIGSPTDGEMQNRPRDMAATEDDVTLPPATPFPTRGSSRVVAFSHGLGQIKRLNEAVVGDQISGFAYLPSARRILVIVDGRLALIPFTGQRLRLWHSTSFDDPRHGIGNALAGFRPDFLSVSPDERYALLSGNRDGDPRPWVVLVRLVDLRVIWREELPRSVNGLRSGVWTADSGRVFLGCVASGRRNQTALALLDYQLTGGILQLTSLVDLPVTSLGTNVIASLILDESAGRLFLWQIPQRQIVEIPIDAMDEGNYRTFLPTANLNTGQAVMADSELLQTRRPEQLLTALRYVGDLSEDSGNYVLVDTEPTLEIRHAEQLPVPPASVIRVPLSNRFWVALASEPQLVRLRIHQQVVILDLNPPGLRTQPEWLAMDDLGDYLFLAGQIVP